MLPHFAPPVAELRGVICFLKMRGPKGAHLFWKINKKREPWESREK
jgi:hypothetical protein